MQRTDTHSVKARIALIAAMLAVGTFAIVLLSARNSDQVSDVSAPGAGAVTEVLGPEAPAAPLEAGAPNPESLPAAAELALTLEPDDGIGADPASVRIGIARVSAEARVRHLLWLQDGARGAGPRDPADLAEVGRWTRPEVTVRSDGAVDVGPVTLEAADQYVLQARGTDGLRFYRARFSSTEVPRRVRPIIAGGLVVELPTALPVETRIQLLRRAPPADPGVWQPLLRDEAPQLQAAFDESGAPFQSRAQWMPLAPAGYEAVLLIGGVEAERRPVQLTAGEFTRLSFDAARAAEAFSRSIDLELELVSAVDGTALTDVGVHWLSAGSEHSAVSDFSGRTLIAAIDRTQVLSLQLQFPPDTESELPNWPERRTIELAFDADPARPDTERLVRRRVEVSPLQWLIVAGEGRRAGPPARGQPYPVHALQRWSAGQWQQQSAEQFRPIGVDLAVSIEAPGRYRVVAALSPWNLSFSAPVEFLNVAAPRQRTALIEAGTRARHLRLEDRDGLPLRSRGVHVVSPLPSLPAVQTETDADGALTLENANVERLNIEPAGLEMRDVRLDTDPIRVRFAAPDVEGH